MKIKYNESENTFIWVIKRISIEKYLKQKKFKIDKIKFLSYDTILMITYLKWLN